MADAPSVNCRHHSVKPIVFSLTLVVALTACGHRNSRNSEVEALRREVERLKAAQSVVTPVPRLQQAKAPEEYQRFVAESRRLTTAISGGISFQEFHNRFVEITSLAQETERVLSDRSARALVTDFALALDDAHALWAYKVQTESVVIHLPCGVVEDNLLGRRWCSQFAELCQRYSLGKNRSVVLIDTDLKKILGYIHASFQKIEAYHPNTW